MLQIDGDGPVSGNMGPSSFLNRRWRSRAAFTLIELLVVVVIVGLLALVGIVNVLRARLTGNETVALSNLRQLAMGLRVYHSVNNTYPDPLGLLSDATPYYVPDWLTGGSGANGNPSLVSYSYEYVPDNNFDYTVVARPTTQGVTGVRRFFVDETGVLRYTTDGTDPTANSPVIP